MNNDTGTRQPHGHEAAPKPLPRVAALVLGAGRSTRMGRLNKLLSPMPGGRTMIAQTLDHVIASLASPVIVVTGHQHHDIKRALAGRRVIFRHATDYAQGLSASLKTGVASLPCGIDAVCICLGDMPLIESTVITQLIAAFDPARQREIIIPNFRDQRGNPVLWGKRFFPELLKLSGDIGASQIIQRFSDFVMEIPVATDSILRDFDTPDMIAALSHDAKGR